MKYMMSIVLVGAVAVGSVYAAKPERVHKEDTLQGRAAANAAMVAKADVGPMDSAIATARVLAAKITSKEDILSKDNVVRCDLKNQLTVAFGQVCDLFNQGVSKLTDVVSWCQALISGVKGPNGQQLIADLAAMQTELTATVAIMDQLSKDKSLGLTAAADAFKNALQALRDQDGLLGLLLKQSADFATSSVNSLTQLTALLNKVNANMIKASADYVAADNAYGTWTVLGGLLSTPAATKTASC